MLPMIPRSRLWLNMCGSKLFKKPLHPNLLGDPRWSAGCIKGWWDIRFELKERVESYFEIAGQLLPNLCTGGQGWSFPTKFFNKSVSSKVEGCRVQTLISWTCNFFGFVWKASFCSLFQQHFLEELWRNGMERHFLVWALGKKQQESFLAERKRLEVPWDEVWISWNSIDSSQTPFGNVHAYLLIFVWFSYEFLIWKAKNKWPTSEVSKFSWRFSSGTWYQLFGRCWCGNLPTKNVRKTGFAIKFSFFLGGFQHHH